MWKSIVFAFFVVSVAAGTPAFAAEEQSQTYDKVKEKTKEKSCAHHLQGCVMPPAIPQNSARITVDARPDIQPATKRLSS